MRIDDIRHHLHVHPFQPIRIFVSDGSYYDVIHHDFMMVTRSKVIIGLKQTPGELPEQEAHVDPVHITRIEPLDGRKVRTNGRKARS